jgi:NAD(P)-dependent dehydrogenase (short-subunit alcohol dehydrogenase family)
VAAVGRDRGALDATVGRIEAARGRALAVELDIREVPSLAPAVERIEDALGPVEILVNNAGVQRLRLALDVTEEDWDFVFDTNLRAAFFMAQAVARRMVPHGRGRIVNVASMAAFKAVPERSAYNSAKAALVQLTRTLAVEWGPLGLRVNAVAPTFVDTELSAHWLSRDGARERIEAGMPIRRLPSVEEVAAAVAYLVSPDAAAINGVALPVDGGFGAT